jgi:hypothetical protein
LGGEHDLSSLAKEIEEIIDYAKGNFFPASNLLKHALVIAKKLVDKEFSEFISQELKGYKKGTLPAHRKIRGQVIIIPRPFGRLQYVSLRHLDAEDERKVSLAYVGETVPILESSLNSLGDQAGFPVGFSPENQGILPALPNSSEEYGILLHASQLRELLDDVRTIVLEWAVKREREIAAPLEKQTANGSEDLDRPKRSPVRYLRDNKQWIFNGIGAVVVTLLVSAIAYFVNLPGRKADFTQTVNGLTTQKEVLEVPRLGDFEVFYPKPFISVPNLNFNKKIGSIYIPSEYQVLEQRKDGFKIRIVSIGDGRAIEWIAVGPTK